MAQFTPDPHSDDMARRRQRPGCLSLLLIVAFVNSGLGVLIALVLGLLTVIEYVQTGTIITSLVDVVPIRPPSGLPTNPYDAAWMGVMVGVQETIAEMDALSIRVNLVGGMISVIELLSLGMLWSWKRLGYYLFLICVALDIAISVWAYGFELNMGLLSSFLLVVVFAVFVSLFVITTWGSYE